MNEARTPTTGIAIVLRVAAVLFALGVVVWLVVEAQRKARQPAAPEGAPAAPGSTPEDTTFLPTSKSAVVDPALLGQEPAPFLHGSKSMVIEPGSEPPTSPVAPPASPAVGADTFLPTSKSLVIQPSAPKPDPTFLPSSKSAPVEPRR